MLTTLNNLIFMTWLQLSNTNHHGKGFQILAPWLVSIKFSELTFKNQLFNIIVIVTVYSAFSSAH